MMVALVDKQSDFVAIIEKAGEEKLDFVLPGGRVISFTEKDNGPGFKKFMTELKQNFIILEGDL